MHAGPELWGAQNLPDAVFFKVMLGKKGPFWNTCMRAHCNLVTPLETYKLSVDPVKLPVTLGAAVCQHTCKQLAQIVVVGRLKEVQSPYVVQVLAQLV